MDLQNNKSIHVCVKLVKERMRNILHAYDQELYELDNEIRRIKARMEEYRRIIYKHIHAMPEYKQLQSSTRRPRTAGATASASAGAGSGTLSCTVDTVPEKYVPFCEALEQRRLYRVNINTNKLVQVRM